jgi:hypothetical protein
MSSGSPGLRERLRKLKAAGERTGPRQKTKPSKTTGPPQFSPVLTAKAAAPAPTATAPTPKTAPVPAPVPAPAPAPAPAATPTIKKLQAAFDAPAPDTLASTPPASPARARAHSAPETLSPSSSLGSIADMQAEAEAARRRKEQLQAENAKNAERLGSPRRDPLAAARTPPASPPASSPPRSPRRPTLEMEELAAAEAAVVAKLEADAKRAAAAKAKREKELRRRRSPSASPRQQAASRKSQAAPAEPSTATAAKPAPAIPAIKSSPPVAGKSARKPRRSGPPKLLLDAPKLHDLPLDGPRTARATVKALPPVNMRVSPPLEVLLAAFASVLSRHARQDVVVVGVEGHPVALACEKNDAFCERVEKARAALRLASLTLEDVLEATSTVPDRTYHPVYQASIAATHEFGSELLDLELVPTHSELGLRLCGNQIYGAFVDGVAMPVPHRSTEPGRPRHRRERT